METGAENVMPMGRGERVEGVCGGKLDWVDLTNAWCVCVWVGVEGAKARAKGGVGADMGMGFGGWVIRVEAG